MKQINTPSELFSGYATNFSTTIERGGGGSSKSLFSYYRTATVITARDQSNGDPSHALCPIIHRAVVRDRLRVGGEIFFGKNFQGVRPLVVGWRRKMVASKRCNRFITCSESWPSCCLTTSVVKNVLAFGLVCGVLKWDQSRYWKSFRIVNNSLET